MNEVIKLRSCWIIYTESHQRQDEAPGREKMRGMTMPKMMWKIVTVAGLAAALVLPGLANAESCYERKKDNQATGAVVGAVAGGAIGNATSGRRSKGTGTVLGAVVGAAVGASVGKNGTKCHYDYDDRYSYNDRYDRDDRYDRRDRRDDRWDRREDRRDDRWDRRDDRRNDRYDRDSNW